MLRTVGPILFVVACGGRSPATPTDASDPVDTPRPPPDADPCGLRGGARGLSHRDVMIDGKQRTYLVYLPTGVSPETAIPLVMVFHGYTMSGQLMFDVTDYQALADREHVALALPDGQGGPNSTGAPWNVGTGVCPSVGGPPPVATGDDFALIDAIKGDVSADQCVDRAHVYATGFSMGGYFTHQVGCQRSDIRGVAPHSGGTHDLASCTVGHRPIIIFHGSADPVIPAGCDVPGALPVLGVEPSALAWAKHNGCATTTTSRAVQGGTCERFDNCPADGQVEVCSFIAMGHCWAGGVASTGIYACPTYASATTLAWQFFQQFAW